MSAKVYFVRCVGAFLACGILWAELAWAANGPAAAGRIQPALTPQATSPTPATLPNAPAASGEAVQPIAVTPETDASQASPPCGDCDDLGCFAPICSPPGRFWFRADWLMWWTNGMRLPALVTTSPQGTPVSQAGVLPGATVLFGGETVGNDGRAGVHTTIGMWLDCAHKWDLEFDYFMLGDRQNNYDSGFSTGNPILTRPFYNVQTNAQASELVAFTDQVEGRATVGTGSSFWSPGVSLSYNLCSGDCGSCDACGGGDASCDSCNGAGADACGVPMLFCCRTDLILGLRYYNYSDFVGVTEDLRVTATGPTQGTLYTIHDNFNGKNEFYGSEIGLRTKIYRGRWSIAILTKLAIGNTHETVDINGQTVITPTSGSTQTYNTGVLASSTNSGVYQRDDFTIIPELNIELGYQLTSRWRAYIGYDVLYWGNVAKAADQIDLNADPRNFPPAVTGGLPFPAYPGRTSSFWAQGFNLGAEFRF